MTRQVTRYKAKNSIRPVRGHRRVVAMDRDLAPLRAQDDVVVDRDRLEEGPQLVVAVVARAEHFEAQVHLRMRAQMKRPPGGGGHQRPLQSERAWSASIVR